MTTRNETKELENIVNINRDACEFYNDARTQVKDNQLKMTFSNLEALHRNVMTDIQIFARRQGVELNGEETMMGRAAQFWAELMASVSNDVDETFITHLEEAEDRCLHAIENAINNDSLSPEIKQVLRDNMAALQKSHDYMKALKETTQAVA